MAKNHAELADLKQKKEDIEDDKHCLDMEMSADRERLQGLMVQYIAVKLMSYIIYSVYMYMCIQCVWENVSTIPQREEDLVHVCILRMSIPYSGKN